ncbi:MAG: polyprenol monophosphomannose synthase [Candidatus Firestonebacteria bacterium]|nr:polyprenol monophosphomannose synthase [Candidatus Firestonebacteria bacterium]
MKTCVVIPTYNESKNIEKLIKDIINLNLNLEIIIVDDDSPDGTWNIVSNLTKEYPHLYCIRRCEQKGRGSAGIAGFKYALSKGADYIIEMDADFSHHPCYIPIMLEKIKNYDIVVGSRFVGEGKDQRGFLRHIITLFANFYIRQILKIKIHDCTSGYRCFKRNVLEAINIDNTISLGPAIVQEFLYKAYLMGFTIGEIPIVFVDRVRGKSTFNWKIMLQGFLMVLILRYIFSSFRLETSHKTNASKTIYYP